MKLKNKLLPLVGVATACAAVAPLALTSCKSGTIAQTNLCDWFVPTITPHDHDIVSLETATEWYFGSEAAGWKTDTKTFVEDMQWSTSMLLNIANYSKSGRELAPGEADWVVVDPEPMIPLTNSNDANDTPAATVNVNLDYNYYNVTLNSIEFGTTWDSTKTNKYPTVSYSFDYDYEYEGTANSDLVKKVSSDDASTDGLWHYTGTFTVTNLPITLSYFDLFFSSGDYVYVVQPNISLLTSQLSSSEGFKTAYQISDVYSYNGDITSTSNGVTSTQTKTGECSMVLNNTDSGLSYLDSRSCPIYYASYYLFSVGCNDWK